MKNFLLFLVTLLTANWATAQIMLEPRPYWVNTPIQSPVNSNFLFVYGCGIGNTASEAEFEAWKNAMYVGFQVGGFIGTKKLDGTFENIYNMNDLEAQIPQSVFKRNRLQTTRSILMPDGKVKIYILLQIIRDASKSDGFNDYPPLDLKDKIFDKELKRWNEQVSKSIEKAARVHRREIRRETDNYFIKGNNTFIALGLNLVFPNNSFDLQLFGRYGEFMGVGVSISYGITSMTDEYKVHYNCGFRFYPYKDFFISANYGIVKYNEIEDADSRLGDDLYSSYRSFFPTIGYHLILGNKNDIGAAFFMNIEFGGYMYNNNIHPIIMVGIGCILW